MRRRHVTAESGQVAAEYVLIAAAVAIGCAMAVLFFGGAVTGLFGSSARPLRSAPLRPPAHPTPLTYPTTVDECVDDGWRDFPQFADEATCTAYIDGLTP